MLENELKKKIHVICSSWSWLLWFIVLLDDAAADAAILALKLPQ